MLRATGTPALGPAAGRGGGPLAEGAMAWTLRERLTDDDSQRGDYLAASHLHRYALAAELCAGLRVLDLGCGTGYGQRDARRARGDGPRRRHRRATRRRARQPSARGAALGFAPATRSTFLRAPSAGGLRRDRHVRGARARAGPGGGARRARAARPPAGALLVSVPNSRAFRERNPLPPDRLRLRRGAARLRALRGRRCPLPGPRRGLADPRRRTHRRRARRPCRRARTRRSRSTPTPSSRWSGFGSDAGPPRDRAAARSSPPRHTTATCSSWSGRTPSASHQPPARARDLRQARRGRRGRRAAATRRALERIAALEQHVAEVEGALHQEWAWRDAARYRAADRAVCDGQARARAVSLGLLRRARSAARATGAQPAAAPALSRAPGAGRAGRALPPGSRGWSPRARPDVGRTPRATASCRTGQHAQHPAARPPARRVHARGTRRRRGRRRPSSGR